MSLQRFSAPLLRAAFWSQAPLLPPSGEGFLMQEEGPPDLAFVEPLLRRRLSPLGRAMLHCAGRVAEGQGPLASVFASRHGEVTRTLPILEDLVKVQVPSPTQFSLNVHNAVAGIWSIARQDPSPSISLAAGEETFGWGLLEARSLLREAPGRPVLFVYGEEPLPDLFAADGGAPIPLHALALLLGTPAVRTLQVERRPTAPPVPSDHLQSLAVAGVLLAGAPLEASPAGTGLWSWSLQGAP